MDHANAAGANALADGTAFHQDLALFLQQVAFHHGGAGTALNGFRTGLHDVQLAVVTILGPLDIHRAAVVFLDDQRLLGQFGHFGVGEGEAGAVGAIHVDGLHRLAGLGFVAVDHLDRLAAQVAAQDGGATGFQGCLVHVELVGVHSALHDGFAEAVGGGDEDHVTEAGLGVQGEHHAGGAGFRTDHALHAGGQGDQLVVEALVHAVGDGAVVEQGGEYLLGGADHIVHATDVEEGFLLAGEGRIGQVFGGGGGTHGHGQVVVVLGQLGEGGADFGIQAGGELGIHDPFADLGAGLGQGVDVIHIELVEGGVDAIVQATLLEEVTVGLGGSGKTTRNGNASASQIADHLAQGCVLAPHMLNIVNAELIEGNYVLYQGDLSTNCWKSSCGATPQRSGFGPEKYVTMPTGSGLAKNAAYHSQESFLT
ncbi:hypothetical protein D9M70_342490 [compost metagenome]